MHLPVTRAAEILGVRRATLSDLANGKAALSPEMALRIEKAFGVSMDTLLRMQAGNDSHAMRQRRDRCQALRKVSDEPWWRRGRRSANDARMHIAPDSEQISSVRQALRSAYEGSCRHAHTFFCSTPTQMASRPTTGAILTLRSSAPCLPSTSMARHARGSSAATR